MLVLEAVSPFVNWERDVRDLTHQPLEFKFHWLNDEGQTTTMFSKPGRLDGEVLTLEQLEVPVTAIVQSFARENRIAISVMTVDEQNPVAHLLIQPKSRKIADELKLHLDIARSRFWADHHREALRNKGLEHTYRDATCPVCNATLILTDMPESPQVYCHFCDSLSTIAVEKPVKNEHAFKICEECGMYSQPRKFTIFYFYFLIFFYGFWSKPTWRCPACMRKEAWTMLLGNLPFLLGVPTAITQLVRCYGGDVVGGAFKGLDTGNIWARKGEVKRALDLYRRILERVPHSAGVKYNLAMALLAQGDHKRAADAFELALDDCTNYVPAYQQLRALYLHLGETDRLNELDRIWSDPASEEPEPQAEGEPAV